MRDIHIWCSAVGVAVSAGADTTCHLLGAGPEVFARVADVPLARLHAQQSASVSAMPLSREVSSHMAQCILVTKENLC